VDDKPAWRHLLGGVDALMLNVGLHWVGTPGCTVTHAIPEARAQIEAAFNVTIRQAVRTIVQVRPPGMALWWRSQPAGYRRCGGWDGAGSDASGAHLQMPSPPAGPHRGPLLGLSETARCDSFASDDEAKLQLIDQMALAEATARTGAAVDPQASYWASRPLPAEASPQAARWRRAPESAEAPPQAHHQAARNSSLGLRPELRGAVRDPISVRDPFCWDRLPSLDASAAAIVLAAGGHHLRAELPAMLRTDAYGVLTHKQNATDCIHTCLGATPRLYALAIVRFVLAA